MACSATAGLGSIGIILELMTSSPTAKSNGMEDVPAFTVCILQQGNVAGTIGVVLDTDDLGHHIVLATLEINDSITTLMATATTTDSDLALVVTATLLVEGTKKRLLRSRLGHLDMHIDRRISSTVCRWLVDSNSHGSRRYPGLDPVSSPGGQSEQFDPVFRMNLDNGTLCRRESSSSRSGFAACCPFRFWTDNGHEHERRKALQ